MQGGGKEDQDSNKAGKEERRRPSLEDLQNQADARNIREENKSVETNYFVKPLSGRKKQQILEEIKEKVKEREEQERLESEEETTTKIKASELGGETPEKLGPKKSREVKESNDLRIVGNKLVRKRLEIRGGNPKYNIKITSKKRKLGEQEGFVQDIRNFFESREKPAEKKIKVQGVVERIREKFKKEGKGDTEKGTKMGPQLQNGVPGSHLGENLEKRLSGLVGRKQLELGLSVQEQKKKCKKISGSTSENGDEATKEKLGTDITKKVKLLGMVPRGERRKIVSASTSRINLKEKENRKFKGEFKEVKLEVLKKENRQGSLGLWLGGHEGKDSAGQGPHHVLDDGADGEERKLVTMLE